MTNPVFPLMIKEQDSKFYQVSSEDIAMKTSMDGGYVVSRAKHTRKPRKKFSIGYTGIGELDRVTLQNFWDSVGGGSVIFDWTDIVTGVLYHVRFSSKSLDFKYVGMGYTKLWDISLEMEQA